MKKLYVLLTLVCFIFLHTANAQTRQLSGTVTSADDGNSIPGVSVTVKGNPSLGTVTDIEGNFKISVPAGSEVLVFSFVGMEKRKLPLVLQMCLLFP